MKSTSMAEQLAPPELAGPARPLYVALRLLHLAAVSAALPLAIVFWKSYPGSSAAHPWAAPLLVPGALFWGLFFIVLEQYSYPPHLRGALLATGSIFINALLALRVSSGMALYGAYQVFMSALAAQAVFIVAAAVWFVRKKVGRSGNPAALSWKYFWLLGLIVFGAAAMAVILGGPLADAFRRADDRTSVAASVAAFAFQTLMHLQTLYRGSVFGGAMKQEGLRERLHGSWGSLIALGLIFSLLAALGAAAL